MSSFKDNRDRDWVLEVDTVVIRRVASRLDGFRIDRLFENGARGLSELMGDPVRLVDVLWVMCQAEAERRNIGDEEFGRALVGDTLDAAGVAFQRALADFSPSRQRKVANALLAKGEELYAEAVEQALKEIAGWRASKPVTSSAESSASSPAPPG